MKPRKPDPDPVKEFKHFLNEWRSIHDVPKGDGTLAFANSPQVVLPTGGGGEDKAIVEERIQHVLRTLVERAAFRRNVLPSPVAFAEYLNKHPAKDRILRTVQGIRIDFLSTEDRAKKLTNEELMEQFRVAATKAYYQIQDLFPIATLQVDVCDLQMVAENQLEKLTKKQVDTESEKQLDALKFALEEASDYLTRQWRKLTGLEYSFKSPPPIGSLTARMAPPPLRVNWNDATYGGENQLLNRKVEPAPSAAGIVGGHGRKTTSGSSGGSTCDIATLKSLADNFPESPSSKTDPHYTFPYDLGKREDIFYDYSVILPIRECGVLGRLYKPTQLSYTSVSVLVKKVITILTYLSQVRLDVLLGHRVRSDLQSTLQALVNDLANAPATDGLIRRHRAKVAEWAGVMRLLAKTDMFLLDVSSVAVTYGLTELQAALNVAPEPKKVKKKLPYYLPGASGNKRDVLRLGGPENIKGRPPSTNFMSIGELVQMLVGIDLGVAGPGPYLETYLRETHINELRDHLEYLAGDFYDAYRGLLDAARAVASQLEGFQGGYENFRQDFQRMAGEIVNHAAYTLANLLEQIVDQLETPAYRATEADKRLGLQLVYRQYWNPAGYVQGKLVGHKTLLPGERQKLTRRSFVKTTTEVSTTEDFVATRSQDFTTTQRETTEVTKEVAERFNFSSSASGGFDFGVKVEASVGAGYDLTDTSRAAHNVLGESVMKGSVGYNEKREVKVRELNEQEEVTEVTNELANENREITANYFYYQLHRNYRVQTALHEMRPVLLRARGLPSPVEINERFVSRYIHILINALPAQLSLDAQETVDRIESLAENTLRRRAFMDRATAQLEVYENAGPPSQEAEALAKWKDELREKQMRADESREAYYVANREYETAAAKMNRVCAHLRDHLRHYMQYIWETSPGTDHDDELRYDSFHGRSLPEITRGLNQIGYLGQEEIFEYTGPAPRMTKLIMDHTMEGVEVARRPDDDPLRVALTEYLRHFYGEDDKALLLQRMANHHFIMDPLNPNEVFSARVVQVAQEAVVVETMPGKVPLLEGFQLAHRMLDVQQSCLENQHLAQRTEDKPWSNPGSTESYVVRRYEGSPPPNLEVHDELRPASVVTDTPLASEVTPEE